MIWSEKWYKAIPFFSLFSVVRPTQIFAFSKKKKSYTEGNEGNDTLFQRIVTLIWNISNFLPYRFLVFPCSRLILTTSTFSFLHCRDVDFVTTPCCFQAPWILCWGTGPPSSRLLFQFYFCCFFPFPTDPKSENAFDNKQKKKGGDGLFIWDLMHVTGFVASLYLVRVALTRSLVQQLKQKAIKCCSVKEQMHIHMDNVLNKVVVFRAKVMETS